MIDEELAVILSVSRKADISHRVFTLLTSLKIDALVSVLEKNNPALFADYTRALYQLIQEHKEEIARTEDLRSFFDK